jgi:hypothetical protein
MRSRVVAFGIVAGLLLAGAACVQRRPKSQVKDMDAGHDKARWLAKAVRTLHYRRDLLDVPNYQDLLNMPRSEAVDALMADPLFGDSVLDFGLYFLGFQPPRIRTYGGLTYDVSEFSVGAFPQAIHAAQAVVSGEDFFTFFDRWQPRYLGLGQINSPTKNEELIPDTMSDVDARGERLKRAAEHLKQAITILATATSDAVCIPFQDLETKFQGEFSKSGLSGVAPFDLSAVNLGCFVPGVPINIPEMKAYYEIKSNWLSELAQHREEWIAQLRPAKNVLEIQKPDLFHVPGSPTQEAFSNKFYQAQSNSSTNANRKRAAYTLNTFFCDDLTPLNVALPAVHAGQQAHASDPACQACHYKLDPMAGLFRSRGISGADFSALPSVFVFDDVNVLKDDQVSKYMNSWKEPISGLAANRPWRAGYVRSPDMASTINTWGESYDDLYKIIREAPEVKQCLTRRMAEYYVGNNLVYDGAWLRELAVKFNNAPGPASSAAFKAVVKDLVLSKTFTTDNPEPDQCYDFANGGQEPTLPCKVADIITRNCATCHASVNGPGHLNLKKWTQGADGAFGFEHSDDHGQSLAKRDSLARIIDRLSTPDKTKLMPMNRFMPDVERAKLYKWVDDESHRAQ